MSFRRMIVAFLAPLLVATDGFAQGGCPNAAIAPGSREAFIRGVAPPEGVVCFRLAVESGQRYALEVVSGKNIVIGISEFNDGVDHFEFTAQRSSYELRVTQLMRSITNEPFSIMLSKSGAARGSVPRPETSPRPGAGVRTGRTEEFAAHMSPSARAEAERVLGAAKRANLAPFFASCEREFKQLVPNGRTFTYVNRDRIHFLANGSTVTLNVLMKGQGARGAFVTACMMCELILENGVFKHWQTETLGIGRACPGG